MQRAQRVNRRQASYTAAAIYGGAAIVSGFEAALPGGEAFSLAPGALALVVCAAVVLLGPKLPLRVIFLLGPLGAALVALTVSGMTSPGDCAVFYVWPVIWTAYFFGTAATVGIVAWIGLVHALALRALPPEAVTFDRWLDVVVAVAVVGGTVRVLSASRERLVERLGDEARVDPLTGLLNRRGLDERVDIEIARAQRDGDSVAAIMFDLDHFKDVNDRSGHDTGDRVLEWVGAVLAGEARAGDIVARCGGEEFVVVMSRETGLGAAEFGERVREHIAAGTGAREHGVPDGLRVTISAGVVALHAPPDGASLVTAADRALYVAKQQGRDRVVVNAQRIAA